MKRGLLFLALSLLSPLPAQLAKQPVYRITGQVLNARDDSPVRHAHVTASLVGQARGGVREPVRTDTDDSGRFLVDLPFGGNWQINVSAHNIRPQSFEEHEGYFSGVILTPAVPAYDLVFHAVPDAILSGYVTDEAGEPVRNAQVLLFEANESARQTGGQPMQQMQGTVTDDRGHYELASLAAGRYAVQVQARPWYAANLVPPHMPSGTSNAPSPDPSLDAVYPITWYPGGADQATAGMLTAHPGDQLQADIRLLPEPSAHLVFPGAAPPISPPVRPGETWEPPQLLRGNPNIALILPNGTTQQVFGQISRSPRGDLEIGGLAPGTYQVTVPGSEPAPRTTTVQLRAGSTVTELGGPQTATPITIAVAGDTRLRASQIVLRSTLTGQIFPEMYPQNLGDRFVRRPDEFPADSRRGRPTTSLRPQPQGRPNGQTTSPGGRSRGRPISDDEELTLQVPPGEYEVGLAGDANGFLAGVTARGAIVVGKRVTISESPAHVTVRLGAGFATVQGTATLDGRPAVAALVLLVPASMGDPASLATVQRDQSNTDGSFRMEHVMPGAYILVAIDHGWSIRWSDPDTLRPYLMRGIPLDLHSSASVEQKLTAVTR